MEFQFTPKLQQAITKDSAAFAKDPTTAPEILEGLGEDDRLDHIRQLVASNPNTPIKTLLKLVADFPHEVLDNPVFLLVQLENPEFLCEIHDDILEEILKRDDPPIILVNHAVNYRYDDYVVNALLANCSLTSSDLDTLMKRLGHNEDLLTEIIQHADFCESKKWEIAQNGNKCLQMALANSFLQSTDELPIELMKHIIDYAEPDVLLRIAISTRMTDELLTYLFIPKNNYIKKEILQRFRMGVIKFSAQLQSHLYSNQDST